MENKENVSNNVPPNPPTQTSSGPITIRPRETQDLLPLTHLLQIVYERDSYPVQGTAHAEEFLTQASTLRAWVAEASSSSSSSSSVGEGEKFVRHGDGEDDGKNARGEIVGHVAVSRPREEDVAVRLWRELHPRRGATAAARQGGQEGQGQGQGQGQGEERTEEDEVEEGEEEEPIAVLERLFIHPTARNHGLDSSLLRTAEEWAAAHRTTSSRLSENDSGMEEPKNAKEKPKKKTRKGKGIRLLLFALAKDEPAMRLYRRRGWEEFGRTEFTWAAEGASSSSRDGEGEGEEKNKKKEMEAICFVSPLPPPPPAVDAS